MNKLRLSLGLIALVVTHSACAELKVATLNCFFFFSPENNENTAVERKEMSSETYQRKVENLSAMIVDSGAEFVGLQEIGSKIEATDLAEELHRTTGANWHVLFAQGKDTYTGQDVAAVVRQRPGLKVMSSGRSSALPGLSKHLAVTIIADGKRYELCVVHLIRPIRTEGIEKHARQIAALQEWSQAGRTVPAAIVVLGDFNDTSKTLLPFPTANALTDWQATHLSNKCLDYIYSSLQPTAGVVLRPPYARKPNDLMKALWSDHYLVGCLIP